MRPPNYPMGNSLAAQAQSGGYTLPCGATVRVLCVQSKVPFGQSKVDLFLASYPGRARGLGTRLTCFIQPTVADAGGVA